MFKGIRIQSQFLTCVEKIYSLSKDNFIKKKIVLKSFKKTTYLFLLMKYSILSENTGKEMNGFLCL